MATSPFLWKNNRAVTIDEAEQAKAAAMALAEQAGDTSPVGHWSQGLNRVLQGLMAGYDMRQAEQGKRMGLEEQSAALSALTGSGAPTGPAPESVYAPGGVTEFSVGEGAVDPQLIRQGLIDRGLPEHVADGFLLNFQDESGFNPGINEISPTVPGSRGGYGLYQLTGPRRTAYEKFAGERGVDPSDWNAQLDFLVSELQGPEARAAQRIMSSQDASGAAQAILTDFLRPAPEHRASRGAKYARGGAMPSSAVRSSGPSIPQLLAAASNPVVMQGQGGAVVQALLGQAMKPNEFDQRASAAAQYGLQPGTPEYQAFTLTGSIPGIGGAGTPAGIQELQWRAKEAGLQPGTPEYQEFIRNGGRVTNGMPAAIAALHERAIRAGLAEGTPAYERFIMTGGKEIEAEAAAAGKARAEAVQNLNPAIEAGMRAIANLEAIRDDPALPSITGMVQGRIVPLTQAGTDLNARIDQAKGQVFLEAFESLKGAGQITEIEGKKAEQAIARLERAQSTEAYQQALNDLIDVLTAGINRARDRAGVSSQAPQSATQAAPTAPASAAPATAAPAAASAPAPSAPATQPAPQAAPPQQAIPTISDPAEYAKLPSGAEFIAPDGSRRRKH